jgi:hypothetical protein
MTAPGGITPGGAGRLLQRLIAAQLDGIAARLAVEGTALPLDPPAVTRPGDRVEWSAVAEALAARPDAANAAAHSALPAPEDVATRAALVARLEAALATRAAAGPEPLPTEARPPASLEPRLDANAARLGLLALPLPATAAPTRPAPTDDARRIRGGGATSAGGAHGTGADAPAATRPRPSPWRIAFIATVLGAMVYVLGATLGGVWALVTIGACAAGSTATVLGIRLRRRRRRPQVSHRAVPDTRH